MPLPQIETFETIDDLRNYEIPYGSVPNSLVFYVKCHTNYSDGGGGFFSYSDHPNLNTHPDNDGTVIQAKVETGPDPLDPVIEYGKWLRKIDGYINIRFFGCQGAGDPAVDETDKIQAAIDYAASTYNYLLRGNTIFFPQGVYCVYGTLILRDGVSLLGESHVFTQIRAEYKKGFNDGFLIEMEKGRVRGCNIANITFYGNIGNNEEDFPVLPDVRTKGCMLFKAVPVGLDGGMWTCTFKNLQISGFNGHGIVLEDSDRQYKSPNQSLIFENIVIQRQKQHSHCLHISGQHGQLTFINVGFDGLLYNKKEERDEHNAIVNSYDATKGINVLLEGNGTMESNLL